MDHIYVFGVVPDQKLFHAFDTGRALPGDTLSTFRLVPVAGSVELIGFYQAGQTLIYFLNANGTCWRWETRRPRPASVADLFMPVDVKAAREELQNQGPLEVAVGA